MRLLFENSGSATIEELLNLVKLVSLAPHTGRLKLRSRWGEGFALGASAVAGC